MARLIICADCGQKRRYYAKGLCKPCHNRRWYREHKERALANHRRHYQEHLEEMLAYRRRYDQGHRGELAASHRCWVAEHREEWAAYMRCWREANPDYDRCWREENPEKVATTAAASFAQRQARKRDQPDTLTAVQAEHLLAIGQVIYPGEKLQLDHVVPLSKGGGTTLANMHAIPARLNCSKHDMLPQEAYKQLSFGVI